MVEPTSVQDAIGYAIFSEFADPKLNEEKRLENWRALDGSIKDVWLRAADRALDVLSKRNSLTSPFIASPKEVL